jgi:hypothetical protein
VHPTKATVSQHASLVGRCGASRGSYQEPRSLSCGERDVDIPLVARPLGALDFDFGQTFEPRGVQPGDAVDEAEAVVATADLSGSTGQPARSLIL